jgi:hypothetical protein
MIFAVDWDFPARTFLLNRILWPASGDVAAEVHRFATTRAPSLPSGPYRFRAAGHLLDVRVDQRRGTVLVLGIYRVR